MTSDSSLKHLVFVYGTLKSGEPNSHVMTDSRTGSYKLMGLARTLTKFPLIIGSKFNIPFLLNHPHHGHFVEGEVYAVDEEKLSALDELEAHPSFYQRELQLVEILEDKSRVDVWIYLMPSWRNELYNEETDTFQSYSSKGAHGREYFPDENCECEEDLYA